MEEGERRRKRVVIVGGGYGGVRVALDLAKKTADTEIYLIDPKFHFEHHSTLYRTVTGSSIMEACIPYHDIFEGTKVVVETDEAIGLNFEKKEVQGKSGAEYRYDYLVLALGSEANYFGIPGLKENTFSFKSINDALTLRKHLEGLFKGLQGASQEELATAGNIVVVGAGATGVEISGQVTHYVKCLAKQNGLDPAIVSVNVIEAKDRVLPLLGEEASRRVEDHLRELGVNIFLNRTVEKDDLSELYLKSMDLKTKTVVWTAGVKSLEFYAEKVPGAQCNRHGAVKVGKYFNLPEQEDVFIVGDGAEGEFGGMAQTADRQGAFVAKILAGKLSGKNPETFPEYVAKKPAFAIPVGPNWAIVQWGPMLFSGYVGWMLRRLVDLKYFMSILSFGKALHTLRQGNIPTRIRTRKTSNTEAQEHRTTSTEKEATQS